MNNVSMYTNELAHDKTYNKTCVTSKDSDQPVHPPSMARVLIYPSLDSPKAVEGTCDQRRLLSDCADAQSDQSLRWSHVLNRYCCALAQIWYSKTNTMASPDKPKINLYVCSRCLIKYSVGRPLD